MYVGEEYTRYTLSISNLYVDIHYSVKFIYIHAVLVDSPWLSKYIVQMIRFLLFSIIF